MSNGKKRPQLLQDVWFLETQMRHVQNCLKADPAYGEGVAKALGIELFEPQTA